MKITVTIDGKSLPAHQPYYGAEHVFVDLDECPACGHRPPVVLGVQLQVKVFGKNRRIESHDTYAADAIALCCRKQIGTLRVQVPTVFGVEEDERVLNGPWKVY